MLITPCASRSTVAMSMLINRPTLALFSANKIEEIYYFDKSHFVEGYGTPQKLIRIMIQQGQTTLQSCPTNAIVVSCNRTWHPS